MVVGTHWQHVFIINIEKLRKHQDNSSICEAGTSQWVSLPISHELRLIFTPKTINLSMLAATSFTKPNFVFNADII